MKAVISISELKRPKANKVAIIMAMGTVRERDEGE